MVPAAATSGHPAAPALVTKLAYAPAQVAVHEGRRVVRREWLNVTDDVRNLLRWANKRLGIRYRHVESSWQRFGSDPAEVPVLYLTGHEPIPQLSDEQRAQLRQFLLDGGTIVANACCGAKEFADSFRRLMSRVFPKRELAPLGSEHPVFKALYDIQLVRYQKGTQPPTPKASNPTRSSPARWRPCRDRRLSGTSDAGEFARAGPDRQTRTRDPRLG